MGGSLIDRHKAVPCRQMQTRRQKGGQTTIAMKTKGGPRRFASSDDSRPKPMESSTARDGKGRATPTSSRATTQRRNQWSPPLLAMKQRAGHAHLISPRSTARLLNAKANGVLHGLVQLQLELKRNDANAA